MSKQKILKAIDQAIEIREKGQLKKSRSLFEQIVKDVKSLITIDKSLIAKNLYITAIAEYIIQLRLEAQSQYLLAFKLGQDLVKFDKTHKLNHPLSYRSVSNAAIDLGRFENVINPLKQLVKLCHGNSTRVGDAKAHLSYCLLRTGKIKKASRFIDEAIIDIDKNTANIPHLPAYQSHALLVKALILKARKQSSQALRLAQKALRIAKKYGYHFRIEFAKTVIRSL